MSHLNIRQLLFKVARSPFSSYFIGFAFEHLTPLMPLNVQGADEFAIAFHHPKPYWETHYLVVPKKRVPSFAALNLQDDRIVNFVVHIFTLSQQLAAEKSLSDYTLLVNGGHYQDVPQIHFHLFQGKSKDGMTWGQETYEPALHDAEIADHFTARAYVHPRPNREFHYIISTTSPDFKFSHLQTQLEANKKALLQMLSLAQLMVTRHNLQEYALLTNIGLNSEPLFAFHLVSGAGV